MYRATNTANVLVVAEGLLRVELGLRTEAAGNLPSSTAADAENCGLLLGLPVLPERTLQPPLRPREVLGDETLEERGARPSTDDRPAVV